MGDRMVFKYSCILLLLGYSLATPTTPTNEHSLLQRIFNKLDQDGDGEVTKVEMLDGLNKSFGLNLTAADVDDLMKDMDTVDFDTFIQLLIDCLATDSEMGHLFGLGLLGLL